MTAVTIKRRHGSRSLDADGAIRIFAQTRLLIAEGNYLLLSDGHWAGVAPLLDGEAWYVEVDDRLRTECLTRRHEQFGRSPKAALTWVAQTDEPSAGLIASTRARAQRVFRWDGC